VLGCPWGHSTMRTSNCRPIHPSATIRLLDVSVRSPVLTIPFPQTGLSALRSASLFCPDHLPKSSTPLPLGSLRHPPSPLPARPSLPQSAGWEADQTAASRGLAIPLYFAIFLEFLSLGVSASSQPFTSLSPLRCCRTENEPFQRLSEPPYFPL